LTGHFALSVNCLFRLALVRMSHPTWILKVKCCPCLCEAMPRPKRATKRVFYTESLSSSTVADPQVCPEVPRCVPPLVIRVRPEVPRCVPAVVAPVRSAFRPFVRSEVPRSTPASLSERGRSISSMPELVPILPPTVLFSESSSSHGLPPTVLSSESSHYPWLCSV
jgi:hypothetical protein